MSNSGDDNTEELPSRPLPNGSPARTGDVPPPPVGAVTPPQTGMLLQHWQRDNWAELPDDLKREYLALHLIQLQGYWMPERIFDRYKALSKGRQARMRGAA